MKLRTVVYVSWCLGVCMAMGGCGAPATHDTARATTPPKADEQMAHGTAPHLDTNEVLRIAQAFVDSKHWRDGPYCWSGMYFADDPAECNYRKWVVFYESDPPSPDFWFFGSSGKYVPELLF